MPTKRLLLTLVCALFAVLPREARADEPPPEPSTQRLTLLETELGYFASCAKTQRATTVITTAVGAAALVPAGIVLARRSDPLAKSLGFGMALGGSIPLVFVLPMLRASRLERLRDELAERRSAGTPEPELLRVFEARWEDEARSARKRRVIIGIVDLAVGTASTAAGLYFLLAGQVGGMDRNDQYTVGASLASPGVAIASFGVRSLVQDSIEEMSWEAYRATKTLSDPHPPALTVAPLHGGAAAMATFAF